MSHSSTVVEFDRFRRIKDALSALRPQSTEQSSTPQEMDWYLPGFGPKARISTSFGDLPIEALRVRDDIRTYSGAYARVQMVDKIHLDEDFLRKHRSARPIQIPANAFGPNRPAQDLIVSPGQEICQDAHVASYFHQAKEMRSRFLPIPVNSGGMTYYRFHCGEPTIVRVEGVWIRVRP